jgi:hypothetical protein
VTAIDLSPAGNNVKQFTLTIVACVGAVCGVVRADSIVETADFAAELKGTWQEQACASNICYVDDSRQLTASFTVKKIAKNLPWQELARLSEATVKSRRAEFVAGRPEKIVKAGQVARTVKDYRQTFCFIAEDSSASTRTHFCALGGGDVIVSYELNGPMSLSADDFDHAANLILWSIAPGGVHW